MKKYSLITCSNGLLFICLLVCSAACSTISRFDQYTYTQATSLKVDALNVMNTATEKYEQHREEVDKVQTAIDKIYSFMCF